MISNPCPLTKHTPPSPSTAEPSHIFQHAVAGLLSLERLPAKLLLQTAASPLAKSAYNLALMSPSPPGPRQATLCGSVDLKDYAYYHA